MASKSTSESESEDEVLLVDDITNKRNSMSPSRRQRIAAANNSSDVDHAENPSWHQFVESTPNSCVEVRVSSPEGDVLYEEYVEYNVDPRIQRILRHRQTSGGNDSYAVRLLSGHLDKVCTPTYLLLTCSTYDSIISVPCLPF